ncbi:hypothetical protein SNE40_012618 [Patella caerulea]
MFYSVKKDDTSRISCGELCFSSEGCLLFYWNNSSCYILNTDDSSGIQSVDITSVYVKGDLKDQCNLDGYMTILGGVLCIKEYTKRDDWFAANVTCNQDGGQLLVMKTNVFHLKLEALKTIPLAGDKYNIGGSDQITEGDWRWTDDSPVTTEEWLGRNPNNKNGVEHCLQLKSLKLNDINCVRSFPFLCEKQSI